MVPISRFRSAFVTMLLRAFGHCDWSVDDVGPFLLLNQPLWRTLDRKELFNKVHSNVCADHGMGHHPLAALSRVGV